MIRPPRLPEGGTIGVVAPSAALSPSGEEHLARGVEVLEGLGYRVRLGEHVHAQRWYAAGTPEQRLADLHGMWADDGVHAILMAQGGSSANQLLEGLDHRLLAAHPTIFVGLSDGTTLLGAIGTQAGVVTFHGPNVCWDLGVPGGPAPVVTEHLAAVLGGAHGQVPTTTLRVHREGRATGLAWGGHAGTLVHLLLSGHAQVPDGAILLLEGTGTIDRFHRSLQALRLAGVLDRVAGVVLGTVEGHEPEYPEHLRSPSDVLLDVLGDRQVPVVEIGELGHGVDNLTLPVGVPMTVDTADRVLKIDTPAVA